MEIDILSVQLRLGEVNSIDLPPLVLVWTQAASGLGGADIHPGALVRAPEVIFEAPLLATINTTTSGEEGNNGNGNIFDGVSSILT